MKKYSIIEEIKGEPVFRCNDCDFLTLNKESQESHKCNERILLDSIEEVEYID